MGNKITKYDCFDVNDVNFLTSVDNYTVTRTSGEIETMWKLCDGTTIDPEWTFKSAFPDPHKGWLIYLHNQNGELPSFRPLNSIKPTMLQTKDEILEWRTKVEEALGLKWKKKELEDAARRAAVAKALAEGGDEAAAKELTKA